MSSPRQKLAAIMFSDIAGYTSMMGINEARALSVLEKSREIQKTAIDQHRGTWLKDMGDGILAQFDTAIDAVNAALQIQKEASESLDAKIRIGIHLGDITFDHGDVFGDGVNIASRIESITDHGGIYISESVRQAIRSHPEISAEYLSSVKLKNVSEPIKVFFLKADWLPFPTRIKRLNYRILAGNRARIAYVLVPFIAIVLIGWFLLFPSQRIPALAVLPTSNLSGKTDVDKYMAGLHAELRDEVAKIKSIRTVSRTSVSKYRNLSLTLSEIADELRVDYVLESELYRYDDSTRIQFRLLELKDLEREVLNKEFMVASKDILKAFSEVAVSISNEIDVDLSDAELAALNLAHQVDPEAHQLYLEGLDLLYTGTKSALEGAYLKFTEAISIDPEYAKAYVGLAHSWAFRVQMGYISFQDAYPNFIEATDQAYKLDSTIVELYYNEAVSSVWSFWDWEKAEPAFQKTLEMEPSHAGALAYYAHYLNIMGRYDEAEVYMNTAIEYEPYSSWIQSLYGMHLNHTRQFEKAEKRLTEILKDEPNPLASPALWTIYHNTGNYEKAIMAAQEVYSAKREYRVVEELLAGYREDGYEAAMERVAEAFKAKKDTAYFPAWQIATLYTRANNQEKAIEWLWKAHAEHDVNMPYISCDPIFDKIKDQKGFQELLDTMRLSR